MVQIFTTTIIIIILLVISPCPFTDKQTKAINLNIKVTTKSKHEELLHTYTYTKYRQDAFRSKADHPRNRTHAFSRHYRFAPLHATLPPLNRYVRHIVCVTQRLTEYDVANGGVVGPDRNYYRGRVQGLPKDRALLFRLIVRVRNNVCD